MPDSDASSAAWHNDKMCVEGERVEARGGCRGECHTAQVTPSYNGLALIWKLKWALCMLRVCVCECVYPVCVCVRVCSVCVCSQCVYRRFSSATLSGFSGGGCPGPGPGPVPRLDTAWPGLVCLFPLPPFSCPSAQRDYLCFEGGFGSLALRLWSVLSALFITLERPFISCL